MGGCQQGVREGRICRLLHRDVESGVLIALLHEVLLENSECFHVFMT